MAAQRFSSSNPDFRCQQTSLTGPADSEVERTQGAESENLLAVIIVRRCVAFVIREVVIVDTCSVNTQLLRERPLPGFERG